MSTSGTIGQTTLPTNRLLEKSMRRAGLLPAQITPEIVEQCLDSLFMLIMSLSSRGINLWCVDRKLIPLNVGQSTYTLPAGTIDVLNLLHVTPVQIDASYQYNANDTTAYLSEDVLVGRVGLLWSEAPTAEVNLQWSRDNVIWTTFSTIAVSDITTGQYLWLEVDPGLNVNQVRAVSADLGVMDDMILASGGREIMMTPFNRDDWANQPNKTQTSNTQVNYYFEKLVNPRITVWPAPASSQNYMALYRHRQIQDVGDLQNELELPTRWLEAISWHLALRIAFEVPGVDPQRRQELVGMASNFTLEAEANETDHSPVFLAPRVSVYTR